MSTLKELLKDVPVEWKILGNVSEIKAGQTINKVYIDKNPGIYPVINSGKEPLGFIDKWNTDNDPIGITSRGAGVGSVIWQEGKYFRGNLNYSVTVDDNINSRFVFYILNTSKKQIESLCTFDGIPALNSSKLKTLSIPIPYPNDPQKSLEIQQEIVRILDSLSEQNKALTTALTNEIDNRKKQYEYYREELFRFEGKEVEWKTLGEVAEKISSGGTPKTGTPEYYDGDIPWLRTQEVGIGDIWDTGVKITELGLKNSSAKMIPENCVIVAMYGATVGKVGINKIPLCTNQACANIQLNKEIAHYRYVYYFLLSQYEYIKSLGAGSQTNINAQIVKKLQIPIPFPNDPQKSLAIQQEIVRLLDQFDEATKSIVAALEKEIELRNKQYEYYRNELLMFNG